METGTVKVVGRPDGAWVVMVDGKVLATYPVEGIYLIGGGHKSARDAAMGLADSLVQF